MTVDLERGYKRREPCGPKQYLNLLLRSFLMIYVGIDVAKDKHDCFITNSDGEVLFPVFTIQNNRDGFDDLFAKIHSISTDVPNIKVGLEATGHYSYNLLGYLIDRGLTTYVINPLHTNLYRKSLTFRKTKTDKVDTRTIAMMLMSDVNLKSYSDTSYHNEELKSLTRYRFDMVQQRAQLKQSVSRLVTILFPELEKLVPALHIASIYALLFELPSARKIASCHLTHLTKLLENVSKGRYSREKALEIWEAAKTSIGSNIPAKSLELKHTLRLISELDSEISEIESKIRQNMDQISSPILTIPGIGYRIGAMILTEIGDFSRFDSPDKILAYAGASPSTYQSRQLESSYSHMEKRGSRYLRFALINATRYVCHWDEIFGAYLQKKISEGKHYNVAITHATKNLVRLIYEKKKFGKPYIKAA